VNSDNVARVIRVRPTAAAMQELEDDPHYVPKDPRNLLKADAARRSPVKFKSAGLTLSGHLYRPRKANVKMRTPALSWPDRSAVSKSNLASLRRAPC